jgi:methyl-accepting chemotaxis protein
LSSIYGRGQAEQEEILNKMLGREPSIRQMILTDENGTEFAEVSRLSKSASGKLDKNAFEDLFSWTRRMERFMSPVCIAELNLKFMWDLVDGIKIGDRGFAYVVDRQGNLMAFGDISRVLKRENLAYLLYDSDWILCLEFL